MVEEHARAAHLSSLTLTTGKNVSVFLPPVWRHLPKQFVDDFFDKGELRLSSFATFKTHKNEAQGDTREGSAMIGVSDPVANQSFFAGTSIGDEAYVLSATGKSANMDSAFGDASIEIFAPIEFAAEVANEIPGSLESLMGWCIYQDRRMLIADRGAPTLAELQDASSSAISGSKLFEQVDRFTGPKQLFLKTRQYEDQAEFRFFWMTNRAVTAPLTVKIQAPERFCRRGRPA